MALSNQDILRYIEAGKLIIRPFEREIIRGNGVDLRIGNTIARLVNNNSANGIFDSRARNLEKWYQMEHIENSFIIFPKERVLCHTLEYLKLPEDTIGFCQMRSTFARMGLSIPPTIVDSGFEGQLTIELIGSNFPIRLYAKQKIISIIFHKLITPTSLPYRGKYQKQKGLTLPKLTESINSQE